MSEISTATRQELVQVVGERYRTVSADEKGWILDEFVALTGYHRKHAIRVEYETEDGRVDYRDLELVTEHYSRSQLAGKRQAGFHLFRAGGSSSRTGGSPYDPHHLESLT